MTKITDDKELAAWMKGKPVEFAIVLAARAALRAAPALGQALQEEKEERRHTLILPAFRGLAAASFAGAWPARLGEIGTVARNVRREMLEAAETYNAARTAAVEAQEALSEIPEEVRRFEDDANAVGIADNAVDAASHALQAVGDAVDADRGLASPEAAAEACVAAAAAACRAIDGVHGYPDLSAGFEEEVEDDAPVAAHVVEFWRSVNRDARFLEAGAEGRGNPEELVAHLSRSALWPEGIPVWAGRRWADFKDDLPETKEWSDWVDWYEGRLTGRPADEAQEFARVTGSRADRESPPPTLDEIRDRQASGQAPRFGDPVETKARKSLSSEIGRLRDALEPRSPEHGGIGHNHPPEPLSFPADQREETRKALDELDEETSKDVPDVQAVVKSASRMETVLAWFGRKLDMSVDSFMRGFGRRLGERAADTVVARSPLLNRIASVFWKVLEWLGTVLPLS